MTFWDFCERDMCFGIFLILVFASVADTAIKALGGKYWKREKKNV